MTIYEFRLFDDSEQLDLLRTEGLYVGKRKEEDLIALLYQLDSFYVEIFYRKHRFHVVQLRCTRSTSILHPYLEQIDVEALVR